MFMGPPWSEAWCSEEPWPSVSSDVGRRGALIEGEIVACVSECWLSGSGWGVNWNLLE